MDVVKHKAHDSLQLHFPDITEQIGQHRESRFLGDSFVLYYSRRHGTRWSTGPLLTRSRRFGGQTGFADRRSQACLLAFAANAADERAFGAQLGIGGGARIAPGEERGAVVELVPRAELLFGELRSIGPAVEIRFLEPAHPFVLLTEL